MAKTKPKVEEVIDAENVSVNEPVNEGTKMTDLSVQKRVELYNKERTATLQYLSEKYGIGETVQLAGYPRILVPQLVPIDLLAQAPQQDGNQNQGN